jgi:hypothetical protein
MWLFEIVKNCQFRFKSDFRIRQPLVAVLWKKPEPKNLGYCKNLKELAVFMKNRKTTGHFMVLVIWVFSMKLRTVSIHHNWVIESLRVMFMNLKSHPDNHRRSVHVSTNHPTLWVTTGRGPSRVCVLGMEIQALTQIVCIPASLLQSLSPTGIKG